VKTSVNINALSSLAIVTFERPVTELRVSGSKASKTANNICFDGNRKRIVAVALIVSLSLQLQREIPLQTSTLSDLQ
jgi:hypothetical protein